MLPKLSMQSASIGKTNMSEVQCTKKNFSSVLEDTFPRYAAKLKSFLKKDSVRIGR